MGVINDLIISTRSRGEVITKHHGLWLFGLQRLTGFLLAVYLVPHIIVNSAALIGGPVLYNRWTAYVEGGSFHYLEILIVLGVFFHLFNGLRVMIGDFFALTRRQGLMADLVIIATALIFGYALWVYWPKLMGGL